MSLEVTTRKFYCWWRTCRRRIFTERLPETTVPYGRRTLRAGEALAAIGLTVGARPGARLATQLSVVATADIILRRLRRLDVHQAPTPSTPDITPDSGDRQLEHPRGAMPTRGISRGVLDPSSRSQPRGTTTGATLAEWQRDHGVRSRTPKAVQLAGERR